jgi:hypothetical protein
MIEFIARKRIAAGALGLSALAAAVAATAIAAPARTDIAPYLEVQQVVTADLNDGGDTLTYSTVAAGVDGRLSTRRVEAAISYRYERRIDWGNDIVDEDVHSGVAQARLEVAPGVSLDAGGLAARARADGRGPAFGFSTADDRNIAEVYSVYAGPTVSKKFGDIDVGASYRLAYVNVDDHSLAGVPTTPGQAVRDRYDSSTSHSASASVGMAPGRLPFGWTVGGGYVREDVERLDQNYEGKYIRADIVVPVSPTFAVTGGVGYEDIRIDQDDLLRDVNGVPLLTPGGRLIGDPSRPRLVAFDEDGLIWDVGFIYRPSRRTELQARAGRRYGDMTYTGSLRHEFNSAYGVQAFVYDGISSFGRLVVTDLQGLPLDFKSNRNPLSTGIGGMGGCVFGTEGGQGVCFDDAFQSIDSNQFRHRGATLLFSGARGPWSFGFGGGYAHRKYLAPEFGGGIFTMDGRADESFTLNGNLSRQLSRSSGLSFDAYASWFDSGVPLSDTSFGAGASASYYQSLFYDRLTGFAAIGLYTTDSGQFDSTSASALVGLRYTF